MDSAVREVQYSPVVIFSETLGVVADVSSVVLTLNSEAPVVSKSENA